MKKVIKPGKKPQAEYRDWSPIYFNVVDSFIKVIDGKVYGFRISHIGSTSIEGCGGKGVIDLLCEYEVGCFERTIDVLLDIGFNYQGPEFAHPWPKHRPMLLGNYRFREVDYLIYVHVVEMNKDEVRRFKDFQRILRGNKEKVLIYNKCKMEIIESGVVDTDEYARGKSKLIRELMGELHIVKS